MIDYVIVIAHDPRDGSLDQLHAVMVHSLHGWCHEQLDPRVLLSYKYRPRSRFQVHRMKQAC